MAYINGKKTLSIVLGGGGNLIFGGKVDTPNDIDLRDARSGELYIITNAFTTTGGVWLEGNDINYPANTKVIVVSDEGGQNYLTALAGNNGGV